MKGLFFKQIINRVQESFISHWVRSLDKCTLLRGRKQTSVFYLSELTFEAVDTSEEYFDKSIEIYEAVEKLRDFGDVIVRPAVLPYLKTAKGLLYDDEEVYCE